MGRSCGGPEVSASPPRMESDAVEPTEQAARPEPTGYERTLQQMFELYIHPEVARRQAAGTAPTPMPLVSAQVLFKGNAVEVRLNSEVKGAMKIRLPGGKPMVPGEPVYLHEIEAIERYELLAEDRDHGHFTAILRGQEWFLLFDFRRNQGTASQLVSKAKEYVAAARLAQRAELWGPFCDNLFSASELLAKAQLIVHVLDSDTKSHGQIHAKLNNWGRLGNARRDFVALFNRLAGDRGEARYKATTMGRPNDDEQMVRVVEEESTRLQQAFSTIEEEIVSQSPASTPFASNDENGSKVEG
jgi:hypothetical protein